MSVLHNREKKRINCVIIAHQVVNGDSPLERAMLGCGGADCQYTIEHVDMTN